MRRFLGCMFIIFCFWSCRSVKPVSLSETEQRITQNFNNYNISGLVDHPIRTIRISIHVFQDSLGKGNFTQYDSLGNQAVDWYWLKGLVDDASTKMSVMQPMQMPSDTEYILDSYIRYQVVGQYDWRNQKLFELNRVNPSTGDAMYRFIMEKDEVEHKSNSLHIFLAGGVNKNGGRIASRGIASGAPSKKWTALFNYYEKARTTKDYWPASLVSHEIGHNLGLRHTWNLNDGCDDTPMNPYHISKSPSSFQCWALNSPMGSKCDEIEECSNNLMDYNAWQNALTECQLSKIHQNIKNNTGGLKEVVVWDNEQSENTCTDIYGTTNIPGAGEFAIYCSVGQEVTWYVTPRNAVINPVGSGNEVLIQAKDDYVGKAALTFRIRTEDGFEEKTKHIRIKAKPSTP